MILSKNLWFVDTAGNVSENNGEVFSNSGKLGGWALKMMAWKPNGELWVVTTKGKIGKWNTFGWDEVACK